MYGAAFPMHLPKQDAPTSPQLQQQKSGQLGSWQLQNSCPPSPFDLMLRQDNTSGMRSAASPFDFPMVHSAAPPAAPMPSLGQGASGLLGQGPKMSIGRSAVSPFDIPNGRVQQLLANSNINSSLGRPPPSPFDLPPSGRVPGRSPFDMALAQKTSQTTTSSGSGGRGGLPLFDARSMERSLGSEGSPGTSMLAEGGEDLVGVPQASLEKHQQLFVRYSGLSEAHAMPEWRGKDSFAAEAASFGEIDLRARAENMPVSLSMRVVSAPASFALPMVQRKVFKPPFTLRVEIQYRQPLSLPVSVEVYAINDAAHSKIAIWLPEADKVHAELEGNRISRTLNVSGGMGYGNGLGLDLAGKQSTTEHLHLEDFKFTDLKWAKSSRMSKRWLVFSLRVKDDVVYLLYQLPTVVISRRTDQYSKAHEILTGVSANAAKRPRTAPQFPPQAASVPPPAAAEASLDRPSHLAHASSAPEGVLVDAAAGPQVVDAAYIRHWIHYRYQACGFRRYLSDSDMKALLQQAGTHSGAGQVDPLCWENFRAWFSKGLKTLHQCTRVWNMMKPHAICGFAVSRAAAEALLAEQPLGSFLVRLCSEPGAFAISCCMKGPGGRRYVDHLLIDAVDLQGRNLEAWVQAHQFATQLLDPLADKVYPKAMIFQPQALLPTVGSMGMPPAAAAAQLPAAGSMQQPAAAQPPPVPVLPARPPAQLQATPSNLSLDHLLMLANLTNSATVWSNPPLSSSPGMEGVPDIPERELSLDVLGNLDMCRLESLSGQRLGSIGNLPSLSSRLGGHGGQRLESLGNLESLGKLGLETFGQRLESLGHGDLSSNSLEGISRQLLGSLPENDPALKDMLDAAAASQPQDSSPTQGHGQGPVNMDLLNAWGSLSDMTTLEQRVGEFTNDSGPLQMGGGEYGGGAFSFGNGGNMHAEDAEMRDAQHPPEAKHLADARFGLKDTQMRNGHAHYQQQQQHFPYGIGSEAFWDPISEPQSFTFTSNYSSGGGQQLQQQQQHKQDQ